MVIFFNIHFFLHFYQVIFCLSYQAQRLIIFCETFTDSLSNVLCHFMIICRCDRTHPNHMLWCKTPGKKYPVSMQICSFSSTFMFIFHLVVINVHCVNAFFKSSLLVFSFNLWCSYFRTFVKNEWLEEIWQTWL